MENNQLELSILKEPMAIGEVFAKSGMFPDVKTQSQAVVKILAGKELGISAFQSVSGVYMVNGKLALQANVMASLIKRSKTYDYTVNKLDETECSITIFSINDGKKEKLGDSVFTVKDAAKAGLINKDNWKNYPRNCLFARALSNGARWYCPDIICGWYTTEELEDIEPIVNSPVKRTIEITKEGELVNE